MKILTRYNINLHSDSTPGGLVHVNKDEVTIVPDDVNNHPMFEVSVNSGDITVLTGTEPAVVGSSSAISGDPLHDPADEESLGPATSQQEFEANRPGTRQSRQPFRVGPAGQVGLAGQVGSASKVRSTDQPLTKEPVGKVVSTGQTVPTGQARPVVPVGPVGPSGPAVPAGQVKPVVPASSDKPVTTVQEEKKS
jgi:hypothetical protein